MTVKTDHQRGGRGLRPVIFRMHSLAGIIVAPFIVVAAITGLLYSFAPSLEQWYYSGTVVRTSSLGADRPLAEQISAAQQVVSNGEVVKIRVDPQENTRVVFESGEAFRTIFVDPHTLRIMGDEKMAGDQFPLRDFLGQGHAHLWLGEYGRLYSELAAAWLGALALGGLWLFWQRRGRMGRNVARRVHSWIGFVFAPGMLFLTVTGLTWSLVAGRGIGMVRAALKWTPPRANLEVADTTPSLVDADTALTTAYEAGLSAPLSVYIPEAGNGWLVREASQSWRFGIDTVVVNPSTATIADRVDFDQWPLMAKLTYWLIEAHMGTLFGLPNQLLLMGLALGIISTIVCGYVMWFTRGRSLVAPVGVGSTERRKLRIFLILLCAYAVIAPLFGATLLLALVIDALMYRRSPRGSSQLD